MGGEGAEEKGKGRWVEESEREAKIRIVEKKRGRETNGR